MRSVVRMGVLLLAFSLSWAGPALAQSSGEQEAVVLVPPAPRQGYYAEVLFGGTALNYEREDKPTEVFSGAISGVRFGQMVTPRLGLGMRIGGGSGSADTIKGSLFYGARGAMARLATPLPAFLCGARGVGNRKEEQAR